MCAPHFARLLQASEFELVADTPKGHTSKFAPSTTRRTSQGSPSRRNAPPQRPPLSRWDSSSSCRDSLVKPQKPKVDSPPSLKRMMSPPPPCTLRNVLKPVRRSSIDFQNKAIFLDKPLDTSAFLSDVLENFALLTERADACFG